MNGIGKAVGTVVLAALIASGVMGEQAVTRTPRGSTSETGAVTRTTREQAEPSGIVTGKWELEGESAFDVLYITIERDNGYAQSLIDDIDPNEFAAEVGMAYIGESRSPEGCRSFTFSGPLGMPAFMFLCANDDFYMYGVTTDKSAADHAINTFVLEEPYTPPYGWYPEQ